MFATQLHAHLTGRKLFTSHFRDGVKIGEINRDNHYSPHWQHIQTLRHPILVLPVSFPETIKLSKIFFPEIAFQGDVLATTCVYETTNHRNFTFGGYGIEVPVNCRVLWTTWRRNLGGKRLQKLTNTQTSSYYHSFSTQCCFRTRCVSTIYTITRPHR